MHSPQYAPPSSRHPPTHRFFKLTANRNNMRQNPMACIVESNGHRLLNVIHLRCHLRIRRVAPHQYHYREHINAVSIEWIMDRHNEDRLNMSDALPCNIRRKGSRGGVSQCDLFERKWNSRIQTTRSNLDQPTIKAVINIIMNLKAINTTNSEHSRYACVIPSSVSLF